MDSLIIFVFALMQVFSVIAAQSCSWPTIFTDTIWHDSNRGEVTFTDTSMSGWGVTTQGGLIVENWECYAVNETSTSTLTLVFKATTVFEMFNTAYVAFACLHMTEFSENAYYYYQMSGEERRLKYDRLNILAHPTILTNPPTEDDLCLSPGNTDAATTNEYHVIIRNDKTETAIRTCPSDYLGTHKYTVSDSTSTYCAGSETSWNVCTSSDSMVFNYTLCSSVLSYSEQGIVKCVFDMASGDYHLLTVMTKEITSTQRFTCFMSYVAGNGSMYVSQFPGSCTKLQTPFNVPSSVDGSVTGLRMVLTDKESCDATTSTTSTTTSSTTSMSTTTTSTTTTSTTTTSTTTTSTTTSSTTSTTSMTSTSTKQQSTSTTNKAPITTTSSTTTKASPPPTTTTTTTTTQISSSDNKTVMYITIIVGCIAGILLVILVVILVGRFCCREPKPRPKTPDLNIETLPHKTAGYGGVPWGLSNAPRETTIIEEKSSDKDVIVFPQAKTNDFTITVTRNPSFVGIDKRRNTLPNGPVKPLNILNRRSSVNVPIWVTNPMNAIMPSKAPVSGLVPQLDKVTRHEKSSKQPSETTKTVDVFDGIIMDETVNFALKYSSRMKNVKRDWHERRNSGTLSLMSEKTVTVPTSDSSKNNSRRVSITDVSETFMLENGNSSELSSPLNAFDSFTDTGSCTNDMLVSPISEVSLPVSRTESDTG